MKNVKQRLLKGAIVLAIAVVVAAITVFVLAATEVIAKNPFQLGFVVFAVGIGLVFSIYRYNRSRETVNFRLSRIASPFSEY